MRQPNDQSEYHQFLSFHVLGARACHCQRGSAHDSTSAGCNDPDCALKPPPDAPAVPYLSCAPIYIAFASSCRAASSFFSDSVPTSDVSWAGTMSGLSAFEARP